jgi:hypothetical protein
MSWQTEMGTLLRVLLNDFTVPYQFSDQRVYQTICAAAQLVLSELNFPLIYEADVQSLSITPDPTDRDEASPTRDDNFINLVCLKAACITERGEARNAVRQGISIRDGSSAIDLRGPLQGRIALLKEGYCKAYDDAKLEYKAGRAGVVAGAAILSPFRIFAGYGDQNYYPVPEGRQTFIR